MRAGSTRAAFRIGGTSVAPGGRATVNLELPGLYTNDPVSMPVHVVHGRRDGPVLFVSAAVHGDEINGVEIIRRLLRMPQMARLRGTLLAVPIVNVFGFHNRSRYLPDRRDLNRSFPGSESGSMAGRLAHIFTAEIIARSDVGIDLHTAAIHRANLPQIRADINDPILEPLARTFSAPVLLHSAAPTGSLRGAAAALGVSVMVYEAGEALRFEEMSIQIGVRGTLNVLRQLQMLPPSKRKPSKPSAVLRSSTWQRAPQSGILRAQSGLGDLVGKGDVLGVVADPNGDSEMPIEAPYDGVVIGRANLPLVFEGEALFHVARTRQTSLLEQHLDALNDGSNIAPPEVIEEPPIV
ncbi:MAG: succinylglutamate desuccinylase/aspartoacylase family protein [Chromatiaceae bacterium]|nr:succinylglutamate desuccinylase/aspartoacylase family protein [Gammaproteobacteria bacterium]MCP5300359.1 succinylglutamate desuccinylase/aspartoacylase family protein [Chromatiaceae bacterium]MCP5422431.1 succinylglutamate desuccinylase/aspartoacylase family protein [Chromatiaceae bacterium]